MARATVPVERHTRDVLGEVLGLQHLVRELVQRIAAQLGRGARVRCAALHFHRGLRDAGRAEQQRLALGHRLGGRRLERQHRVVQVGRGGDEFARAHRAHFFVGVHQHGERVVVAPARIGQDLERGQHHRDAALVIGDAGAVDAVAVHLVGLAAEDARRIHRVHVALQHDLALAGALERADDDVGARAGFCLATLGLEPRCLQAPLDHVGHLEQALDVQAARFDLHHLLQVVDDGGLRLLCGGEQLRVGRGLRGGGAQGEAAGQCDGAQGEEGRGAHGHDGSLYSK
jgi:hypothetical protein